MINRGTDAGFKVGTKLEFYAFEEVTDEDTGEVFRNEMLVGKGQVKRADPRQSFAETIGENLGVAKGCLAKVVAAAKTPQGKKKQVAQKQSEELSSGSSDKPLNFD